MANFNSRYWQLWDDARDLNPKITRQEFADSIGVTIGQSNGWLDKGNQPDCDTLLKIAKKANVSVSWLAGEVEVRNFQINQLLKDLPSPIVDELVRYTRYLCYCYNEKEKLKNILHKSKK